ncbi:putative alcohol dehydrogenase [Hypoxylon sp. FL1150]|nr:putative alcohol dehydrogenase [Hypoxylon sp. FL1150]
MSSLPKTYKHAVFKANGEALVIEETALKLPREGEILVKVEACGVCYSDMFAKHSVMGGGFPICPGHEIIGEVAAVGPGVSGWEIDDRIGAGWHGGHDDECRACKKGLYQMCENQIITGQTKNGGYAEYCTIRAEAAVRIPEHVDAAKWAPILCAGMTVYNAIRHMDIPVGETVAIQGIGGLGHLAVQYATRMGYRVVAISRGAEKERYARTLGAHEYINATDPRVGDIGLALKKLGGASLIVTTAPKAESMTPLLKGLEVLGKLLILSAPGELTINTTEMKKKGISVQSWPCGHARDAEETIAFTELQRIFCMSQKFSLNQAQEAYDAMMEGGVRFRAVIVPQL